MPSRMGLAPASGAVSQYPLASIRPVGSGSLPRYMLILKRLQQESGDVVVAARQAGDPDGRAIAARTGDQDAGPGEALRQRASASRALSRGAPTSAIRAWLLL